MPQPEPRQDDSTPAHTELDLRFRQLRRLRSTHALVGIRQVPVWHAAGALTVRHVDFRKGTYRQQVVAELWSRLDYDFWLEYGPGCTISRPTTTTRARCGRA